MTGTPKSFCVLENASCLIWNYLKNGFASTQFLLFLFFRFHLPWSWKKDDDGNPKKFLCPWKCFVPDLKLFEKWLCKYAVSVISFFQISFTMKLKKRWWREPKKVFVSLKMLRAWSEIIWKMALQVRSFCFFFFSALRTSNCANSRYPFLYLHPRSSYIFIWPRSPEFWFLILTPLNERNGKQTRTKLRHSSPFWIGLKGIRNTLAVSIVKPLTKTATLFFRWKVVWKGKL